MTTVELWSRVFGDTPEIISAYWEALSLDKHCFPVSDEDGLCAAAYWYDCGSFVIPHGSELPAAVLYAVAVAPKKRGKGYGQQAVRLAWSDMQKNGSLPLTVPAEPSLFAYYRKTVGAVPAFLVCRKTLSGGKQGPCSAVSAEEYGMLREHFLSDRPHIRYSLSCLKLQEKRSGFFAVPGGCFVLEKKDNTLCAVETLGNLPAVEAALRTLSDGASVTVVTPADTSQEGSFFAMSAPLPQLSGNAPWFGFPFD